MSTDFQKKVWHALTKIPRGKVTTYKLLAKHLGTGAVRAVGTAVGKNLDVPKVPCHRVVRSDGTIGKYSGAGGTRGKVRLLQQEGVSIAGSRIRDFAAQVYTFQ